MCKGKEVKGSMPGGEELKENQYDWKRRGNYGNLDGTIVA